MKMNLFPKTYGRTKGKIKKPSLLNYYKKINKYLIDSMSQYNKDIILEIGSGNGENIIKLSNLYKDKIIIACEVYIDGNSSLVKMYGPIGPKVSKPLPLSQVRPLFF